MHNQPQSNRYTEILDELQLQSWQLELVISGFAIFGLFAALDPVFDWFTQLTLKGFGKSRFIVFGVYIACILTIVNLIIHVLLRALWIAAVGMRSVSGEIDFKALRFSNLFTEHLKKKIGSFDTFIEKLETYSSVIFGLSFLIIFMTMGTFICFFILLSLPDMVSNSDFGETTKDVMIGAILVLFFSLFMISFIDFMTRGWFKKKGGRFYLFFYRITSVLSLSVIYRPLLYNFWDNTFGRKLMLWLLPIYLTGIYGFSSSYITTNYIYNIEELSDKFIARRTYEDMVAEKGDYIGYAAIPSKTIESNFLELTIPHEGFLEDMIFEYDPILKPEKSRTGFRNLLFTYFRWSFDTHDPTLKEDTSYLNAVNDALLVSIDSIAIQEDFVVTMEKDENYYFKKMIPLSKFKEGKHVLRIQRCISKKDSTQLQDFEIIPFWYFPDN